MTSQKKSAPLRTLGGAMIKPVTVMALGVTRSLQPPVSLFCQWIDYHYTARFGYSFGRLLGDAFRAGLPLGVACVLLTAVTSPWWLSCLLIVLAAEWATRHVLLIASFLLVTAVTGFFVWFYWLVWVQWSAVS